MRIYPPAPPPPPAPDEAPPAPPDAHDDDVPGAPGAMLEHLKQLLAVQLERASCGDGMSISFDEPNVELRGPEAALSPEAPSQTQG